MSDKLTTDEIKNKILDFVFSEINIEDVVNIESNAGSIWIELNDNTTKSLTIIDCEPEN